MTGIRVHNRRRPPLTKWLTMAETAELFGIKGEDAPRDARRQLLKAQLRCGQSLMWKKTETNQGHWYTTESLIRRHAPELVDADPEAIQAAVELKEVVIGKVETVEVRLQELTRETKRFFRKLNERLEAIERLNTTPHGATSTRALR